MFLRVRQAIIVDPSSPFHGQQKDILIKNGIITAIGDELPAEDAQEIACPGLHVSPGFVDVGIQIGDPGFEHREDIASATKAAARGGYTAIAPFPNTNPVMDTKAALNYWRNQSRDNLVELLPIGAITTSCNGKDITEMIDMQRAGAIAFSDGKHATQDNGMMMRALQYVSAFGGTVINRPYDHSLAGGGHIHEGFTSTILGMKGISHLAEDIMVVRDINLAAYTNSKVHIHGVSTAGSVDLIRRAKADGVQVTCSVTPLNLVFQDDALAKFNTNLKVLPPLREKSDTAALFAGLKDGTIDIVISNHVPLEEERKKLEFAYADFGAIGLETTFALLQTHFPDLGIEKIVDLLSQKARSIFQLEPVGIAEDTKANLTCFVPDYEWTLRERDLGSKSVNTPLIGAKLRGKVLGIIHNNQSLFFELP
jgi:dihydroorotase